MTVAYAVMAALSLVLLLGYCILVKKKEFWLLLLYICITIVNHGYFLLSMSKTVELAIFANDLAYFGSVFLSMCMFLTIVKLCGFKIHRGVVILLTVASALMFGIVATSGFLPWYYKEVTLVFVDGAAKLEKEYGPLHSLYLVYLISYFSAMIVCIIHSVCRKKIASQKHAALIAAIVFGNIAVWFVEKFIPWDFEFLSVSYLFSEIVLLGVYWMMQDYVRSDLVPVAATIPVDIATMPLEDKILKVLSNLKDGETLAVREREILELILQDKRRKEIADELYLSENTIKTYTRSLYSKIGVSCREDIYSLLTK